jgi:hypothetical protein
VEIKTDRASSNARAVHLVFTAENGMVDSLARIRNVRLLDLTTNLSGASDLMFSKLKGLPRLAEVDVSGSTVTDRTLEYLSAFKSLRKLNLRGTSLTDTGIRKFKKAVPKCQVVR